MSETTTEVVRSRLVDAVADARDAAEEFMGSANGTPMEREALLRLHAAHARAMDLWETVLALEAQP